MLPIVKFIFWFSVILIFYPYIGYLLILKIISFFKSNNSIADNEEFKPLATLLISAYNEEAVIEDKILNSLDLNYPKELLEIVVISDGSNDKTNELVIKYADKGVVLRHYEGRIGKTACLNRAVPLAKGEIIVFSDANSRYDREAIRELVRSFADKEVGFATGFTRYTTDEGLIDSISLYSRIEKITKKLESKIASCVGADGAIFAIRKPLYKLLNDYDINDLVIPLNVIKQGYRGRFEDRAFCTEKAVSYRGEFNRQVRIT
ncbi:MAG TPA: glycosyltransferase family 2 protein, partial [Thermodesulfobacteriota bacterium]|nr:glycosyltransferase family 2 protein [Thermodesulfobacteriota bacterium]